MSNETPFVFSILTTHLNQARFLRQAIDSALTQAGPFYVDFILVDAGSTDNTPEVLRSTDRELKATCTVVEHGGQSFYAGRGDPSQAGALEIRCLGVRFRHVMVEKIGRAAGLNHAYRLADGDIITCLDADDLFAGPSTLAKVAAYFNAHPEACFLYGNRGRIDYDGATLLEREGISGLTKDDLKDVAFVMQQSSFWRRCVSEAVGGFDESYDCVFFWDFSLRCARQYSLHLLDEVLGVKRVYEESYSGSPTNRFLRSKEIINFLIKNDGLTERSLVLYVVNPHPIVVELNERLRIRDERIRLLLATRDKLNQVIRFGRDGDSGYFEEEGWSIPEDSHTWTEGNKATLRIPIGSTKARELILRVRLFTFIKSPVLTCRTVQITVNGTAVDEWRFTVANHQDRHVRIPENLYHGASSLSITFDIKDAVSPASIGEGSDNRLLGIAVIALRVDEPRTAAADSAGLPTLFHITHPKAGSQWVLAVLEGLAPGRIIKPKILSKHLLEDFISKGSIYPTLYISRENFELFEIPSNSRKVIVIRDLRDTLVSLYFSLKHSHRLLDISGAEIRQRLNELSVEDGLLYLVSEGYIEEISEIQLSWLGSTDLFVSYEELWRDEEAGFGRILRHFGIEADPAQMLEVIQGNTFESKSDGRGRGVANPSHHLRKGTPGDWRNVFTEKVKAAFKAKYGHVLLQTGYEQSLDW